MKKDPQLSRRERQIMDVLYRRGRATAADVQEQIPDPPSYSAVRAMLRVLEEKGHVRHEEEALRYVFIPTTSRAAATRSAMAHLVETFFEGSTERAVAALLDGKLSRPELDRLAALIESAKKEVGNVMQQLLIACSVKATAILIAAAVFTLLLRRSSAAARHLVWTVALATLPLLPIFSLITPAWNAPVRVSSAPLPAAAFVALTTPARSTDAAPDWIARVWLAGVALVLGRFGLGTARVWMRTRRSRPMQIANGVQILDAGPGVMPMTWGVFRPVVLLPSEAGGWPADRLRVVLLHELAHVGRRDWLTLAVAEAAVALYWFHPLAWFAVARMRRERERACDDVVLAAGVTASGYAADLLEVARRLAGDRSLPTPAMARTSNLELRLRAVLDPALRRGPVRRKIAALAAAVALLVLIPLAALRMQAQGAGLSGGIYDFSGAAVPEAKVTVINHDTGFSQTIVSEPDGAFSFRELAAGRYQVKVAHPGFALFVRESVTLPTTLDVVLSLGQISESITVSGKRTQNSPPPAAAPRRVRVGGNVQAAKMLDHVRPAYPAHAEAAGIQGRVLLQAVIRTDGTIGGLSVLSSKDPELTESAMESVRQWRYHPTLLNGVPVEVITTISVSYRLDP